MSKSTTVKPLIITRSELDDYGVKVKIMYSGICHSDYHHIKNDWGDSMYPMVPGHEIVGHVTEVGPLATRFKVGDPVAIGNMIDSCKHCISCQKGNPQYCYNDGPTWVYNGKERMVDGIRTLKPEGEVTMGGYSESIISHEDFVFSLPDSLSEEHMAESSPLLCAGITMYYPLKHYKMGRGHTVGIAGVGGLGHLGIKMARAMGCKVVALTKTQWKIKDSMRLGAHKVIDMNTTIDEVHKGTLDMIIDTIPVEHDLKPYLELLKPGHSRLHVVGNMNTFPHLKGFDFVFKGKEITSSNVGGLYDTQEMLNWCGKEKIWADVKIIPASKINTAFKDMISSRLKYRAVIDGTTFKE